MGQTTKTTTTTTSANTASVYTLKLGSSVITLTPTSQTLLNNQTTFVKSLAQLGKTKNINYIYGFVKGSLHNPKIGGWVLLLNQKHPNYAKLVKLNNNSNVIHQIGIYESVSTLNYLVKQINNTK